MERNEVINKRAARIIWNSKIFEFVNILQINKLQKYVSKEKLENRHFKDKKYCKVWDHSHYTGKYRGDTHIICNLKYNVPKKTPIVFHNGPNYDYYFIVKELAEEFKQLFTCSGEKNEKYITFTVPIEK